MTSGARGWRDGGGEGMARRRGRGDGAIKAVASYYGLKPSDIKSERRHKSVARPT
jgi:chromosomal replication initiation ATPase DnaA